MVVQVALGCQWSHYSPTQVDVYRMICDDKNSGFRDHCLVPRGLWPPIRGKWLIGEVELPIRKVTHWQEDANLNVIGSNPSTSKKYFFAKSLLMIILQRNLIIMLVWEVCIIYWLVRIGSRFFHFFISSPDRRGCRSGGPWGTGASSPCSWTCCCSRWTPWTPSRTTRTSTCTSGRCESDPVFL